MQGKMSEKKFIHGKTQQKKFMHKMGRILILNQNYNSSRRVFQNAPNGIRACPEKKFMHKMGRILILNQNYNSSRRVFQNAPNGIRACPDFQNFPGGEFPRTAHRKWASQHFNTAGVICRTHNAKCQTRTKITETSTNQPQCHPS